MIRHKISFVGTTLYPIKNKKAVELLGSFIQRCVGTMVLSKMTLQFLSGQHFIQRSLHDKLIVRFCKVDVLINYWDKFFGIMTFMANFNNDYRMRQIMFDIAQIPKEVRYACLKAYVNKCREMYQIAFFQWRKKYPTKTTRMELVDELIEFRTHYTFTRQHSLLPHDRKVDMTNSIDKHEQQSYGMMNNQKNQNWTVNNFSQIGWLDPYPNELDYKNP